MAFNKSKVMDAARKHVEKGHTDKAIKEYLKVVEHDPKDVRVWLKVGDLYAKKGAKSEATETYLKVAKFYSEQGFYLKAVAVYKQILKLDPRLVEVNLKLAELYRQLGLMSDAMQHFEHVASHFHREGKTKEALATIRQLVDLDPDNVATRIKLAELYSKEEMVEDALKEFRHACDYLREHNRQDDFIKVAERLLWHRSDDIPLCRELAQLYLRRNDPRRALQKLQICFKSDPRDVETLALLAQAFQALDQKSKTVSVLKELARILGENGQSRQAEEVHKKILAFVPDDPDSLAALGRAPASAAAPAPAPEPAPAPAPAARQQSHGRVATPAPAPSPSPRVISQSDVRPNRPAHANPTGSLPLVRDGGGNGAPPSDFNYDEKSEQFVAEIAMDEESFVGEHSATGEAHADEIVKILTESDVYVKYGLAQKAIDHIRRVFDLDPDNVEARERLKDILRSLNRDAEAVDELIRLAEAMAPQDPDRASDYLRELFEIDPRNERALSLADRLGVAGEPEMEIVNEASDSVEVELGPGHVAPVDDDFEFDELEFDELSSADLQGDSVVGVERPESEFEFELDQISDAQPEDEPVAAAPDGTQEVDVGGVISELELEDDDELAFDDVADPPLPDPSGTQELSLEDLESVDEEVEPFDEGISLDAPTAAAADHADHADHADLAEQPAMLGGAGGDVAPPMDDPGPELAAGSVASENPAGDFDAGPTLYQPGLAGMFGSDLSEQFPDAAEHVSDDELLAQTAAPETLGPADHPSEETEQASAVDTSAEIASPAHATGSALEEELDEADFYFAEGMLDEARDALNTLLERYPNHPLILAKLQDVDAMANGTMPEPDEFVSEFSGEVTGDLGNGVGHAAAADDPLGEFAADLDASFDGLTENALDAGDLAVETEANKPAVMLEKPIDDADAETHFDLGLAYKEMGLLDEALKAFDKVSKTSARPVECRLMIGLCQREMGNLGEAVQQFKNALYVDNITEDEKLGLYYEIGSTYQSMNDPGEALYYFEMVQKKDPAFRDVGKLVPSLQAAVGSQQPGPTSSQQR